MPLIKVLGDNTFSGVKKGEIKLNIKSTGIPFNIPRYNRVPFKLFGNGRYGESYQAQVRPKSQIYRKSKLAKTQMDAVSIPRTRGPMQIPKIVRRNGYSQYCFGLVKVRRD